MARTIKIKAGVLFTAGAMALAVAGMSTPAFAQRGDGDRGERAQREAARPQPQPQGQPQARGNDGQRGNWRGNAGRPQQQAERQQQRPQQGQQASPNEIRRNLPGWAGGTRNGEPVSRTNPPQGNVRVDRGGDRNNGRGDNRDRARGSSWQNNNDRRDDNRDRGSGWQGNNDRRGDNDRWRGNGNNNDRRGDNDRWRGNGNNQNRNWDRNSWRRDNRYDWQSYRSRNRSTYQIGRYYAPYQNYSYRRVGIGFSLGSMFYGNRYWVNDPWQYRLPAVYGPYRWVRYYDDVVLVDTYSGEVVDVIYDFFW